MSTARETIQTWFLTGLFPTSAQFAAWLDSYWHKDDKLPLSSIEGIDTLIDLKANVAALEQEVEARQASVSESSETGTYYVLKRSILATGQFSLHLRYNPATAAGAVIVNLLPQMAASASIFLFEDLVDVADQATQAGSWNMPRLRHDSDSYTYSFQGMRKGEGTYRPLELAVMSEYYYNNTSKRINLSAGPLTLTFAGTGSNDNVYRSLYIQGRITV